MDGPHHQRLSSSHVSRSKYLLHRSLIFFICHGSARRLFYAKSVHNVILGSGKACRDQHEIRRNDLFTARHLTHVHASGLLIFLKFQSHRFDLANLSLAAWNEFLHGSLVNSWILPKDFYGFLLTIVCLQDSWPLRPWIGRGTF